MKDFLLKNKLLLWTIEILLIVLIIFVCTKISFVFHPIIVFFSTLFLPFLIAGFLFFIFNPVVNFITKYKIPRTVSILVIYIIFIGLISAAIAWLVPLLVNQITDLINFIQQYINKPMSTLHQLMHLDAVQWVMNQDYVSLDKIKHTLTKNTSSIAGGFKSGLTTIFSIATSITITIITVPFILFYLLKDSHKLSNTVIKMFPDDYKAEGKNILENTADTLATYIQGQMIVCLFVGTCTFVGYLIIGLKYALLLGIVIAITNIIPYLGPFIGVTPALVVGLLQSPLEAVLVIVVVIIVQQIDGNIISPLVIGKKLDLHPLTIIVLLLVAGNLAGILGMILAVPTYAVTKTLVINLYKLFQVHNNRSKIIE